MIRNLFRNIVAHYLGLFLIGAASLLVIPLFVNKLGVEGYGILVLGLSVAGLFQFLDLGISTAAVKYIAEWKAVQDQGRMQAFYRPIFYRPRQAHYIRAAFLLDG